ncbi:hypothetical protein AC579_998 [Pseudocercospora musae]|uniref:Uncharacterized protein n=1 Tax=Pseudocercospora musae TaxID=113226 RepID=A0A139IB23_9PEZI|nr:hypothetical protein AC579_998 [Pseudocercospora musae]
MRLPNSIGSKGSVLNVPACCMSLIVATLSSLPEAKSKTRTLRSGKEKVANCSPEGDTVIEHGTDFDFLNSNRFVLLFISKTLEGFSYEPEGCQYSIIPLSSADKTQSYAAL